MFVSWALNGLIFCGEFVSVRLQVEEERAALFRSLVQEG